MVNPVLKAGQVYTSDVEITEVVPAVLILETQRKFQRQTVLGPKQQEPCLQGYPCANKPTLRQSFPISVKRYSNVPVHTALHCEDVQV